MKRWFMTFTREPVRMLGTLRGNNETAECMVSAVRVTLSGTRLFKDCQYVVEWVSKTLPLGTYRLAMEGKIIACATSRMAGMRFRLDLAPSQNVKI
jgi:hypothetical protein